MTVLLIMINMAIVAYIYIYIYLTNILFYLRLCFYHTDTHIFILFNEMLTDNIGFWLRLKAASYSCFLQQPW
jgi:hypothetical protein